MKEKINVKNVKLFYNLGLFFVVVGLILFGFSLFNIKTLQINNIYTNKNIPIASFENVYSNLDDKVLTPVYYDTLDEAVEYSKYFPTSFKGNLTHYGPDCELCSGRVGCNGQDVRNGNIYYNDKEYGKVRIVATTKKIPCGSIIRINVDKYDPNGMLAIVLDRGVPFERNIDLLKESQKAYSPVRTTLNVVFDIIRYGY